MRWRVSVRPSGSVLIGCCLALLLGGAVAAVAAIPNQPAISAVTPASGAVVSTWNPSITASVSDSVAINGSAVLWVDGVSRAVALAFPEVGGHWEGSGCDAYWVPDYDYLHGTLSYASPTLSDGSHAATITVTDAAGNANSYAWSFVVQAAPKLASCAPANGSAIKGSQPLVSATLSDNGTIAAASLKLDGAPFSATWNASTKVISGTPSTPLADGLHTVTVSATDTVGLASTTSWTFSTVNNASTTFSSPTPAAGSVSTAWNPTVSVSCSDAAVLTGATMLIDGATVSRTFTLATGSRSGVVSFKPASLADGSHTAKVTVTNNLGFSSTYSWTFTVGAPPQLSTPVPAEGGWATTLTPVVSATVADNGVISTATVTIDGMPCPAVYDAAAKKVSASPMIPLTDDASHTAEVTVRDTSGYSTVRTWTFRTHATLPAFGAPSPAPGSATLSASPAITIPVYDAMGLTAQPSMTLDGKAVSCWWGYVETGGQWVGSGCDAYYEATYDYTRGTISFGTSALSNGAHTVTVRATNNIGGVSTYAWSFTVGSPPQLTTPSPAAGSCVATLTPAISVKVTSNAAIASAVVTVDGVLAVSSYNATTKLLTATPLGILADTATHNVSVLVTDVSGLSGSLAWDFRTDSTPPVLGGQSPAAQAALGSSSAAITLDASDWSGLDGRPTMTLDGVAVAPSWNFVELSGQWVGEGCDAHYEAVYDYTRGTVSFSKSGLTDGPHTVTATVRNNAGLASTASWTFTVAEPPKLTVPSPSDGAWIATLTPTLSVKVADNGAIASSSVFIDGVAAVSWYDSATKLLSARPAAPLADDSPHSVVAMVTDTVGASSTLAWSFKTHTAPPTIATRVPAASTTAWNPEILLTATDLSGLDGRPTMTVDGTAVPCVWNFAVIREQWVGEGCDAYLEIVYDYTVGTVSYRPSNLTDGPHTISVTVRNNAGVTRTEAWTINVQSPPRLSGAKPSGTAWVTTQTPQISIAVAENSAVRSAVATLDGAAVSASYDAASGRVNVAAPAALTNDMDHDVAIRVTDTSGNDAALAWRFHVQTYPKMPTTGAPNCESCHTGYPAAHPMADCNACHGAGGPVEDCRPCHGYGGHDSSLFDSTWWAGPYPCERCHQQAYSANAPVHPADDSYHVTSRDMTECRPCHVAPLTVEHYRYKDSSGAAFTCATCHSSSDSRVRAAISAGNTECSACHVFGPGGDNHVALHDVDFGPATNVPVFTNHVGAGPRSMTVACSQCHPASLVDIHGHDCDLCHQANGPRSSFASWNGTCQQGDCHPTLHVGADAAHSAIAAGANGCNDCHEPDYSVVPGTCTNCHSATDVLAPVTSSNARSSYIGPAAIALTATDAKPSSGIRMVQYRLDGGAVSTGSTLTVAPPATGSATHTLEFWSVDWAGNVEATHGSATFAVIADTSPPVTTSDARPSYDGLAKIGLTARDDGTSPPVTYYRIDGQAATRGTSLSVAAGGTHALEFWSVDAAGNEELPHRSVTFVVTGDTVPPVTTSDAPPYDRTTGGLRVNFSATDVGSGVSATYCRVDGGGLVPGGFVYIYTAGVHTIEFWSVDAVGNEEAHKTVTVVKDWMAPRTSSDARSSYVAPATITLTAADDGAAGVATTYYSLDGGAQARGTSITVSALGTHTLRYWSVDRAGNVETAKSVSFTVSESAQTGSITMRWVDPPPGAWTYYYVYDANGKLVASSYNTTGSFTAVVPVSTSPYTLRAYWWDPDWIPTWSEGSALIDVPGKVVVWDY